MAAFQASDETDLVATLESAGVPPRLVSILSSSLGPLTLTVGDVTFLTEADLTALATTPAAALGLKLLFRKVIRPMAVNGLTRSGAGRVPAQAAADALVARKTHAEHTLVAGGSVLDGQGKVVSIVSTRGGAAGAAGVESGGSGRLGSSKGSGSGSGSGRGRGSSSGGPGSVLTLDGILDYVSRLPEAERAAVEVVDVSRNNLLDEDLVVLARLVRDWLPQVRVVDVSGNRIHGFVAETRDAVGEAVAALLAAPRLEALVLTANPFATKDSLPFFTTAARNDLERLVFIPAKFVASRSWESLFALRPKSGRASVIDAVAAAHARFYAPRRVPISPSAWVNVPPCHVLLSLARSSESAPHEPRLALLPSGAVIAYTTNIVNGAEAVTRPCNVYALDTADPAGAHGEENGTIWAALHDMKWYNEVSLIGPAAADSDAGADAADADSDAGADAADADSDAGADAADSDAGADAADSDAGADAADADSDAGADAADADA